MVKRLEISLARSAGLSGWGTLGRPDWLQLSERDLIIHYSGSESIRDPSCRHGVSSQVRIAEDDSRGASQNTPGSQPGTGS